MKLVSDNILIINQENNHKLNKYQPEIKISDSGQTYNASKEDEGTHAGAGSTQTNKP